MYILTGLLGAVLAATALVRLISGFGLFADDPFSRIRPDENDTPGEGALRSESMFPAGTSGNDRLGGNEDATADFLNGRGSNDLIRAGSGDIVNIGEDADTVLFGNWITDPATVTDFDVNEDALLLIYDDLSGPAPVLELIPSPTDPDSTVLTLNGDAVATLNHIDETSTDSIVLLPQSSLAGNGPA